MTPGWTAGPSLTSVSVRSPTAGRRDDHWPRCCKEADLTAGDFVRWVRQVTDFAGQIADAAGPGRPLRDTARAVVTSMRRGVVTYAPEIDSDEGDDIDGSDYA